ncbi:MAG: SMC-Scp complex subunit ScpB [Clostridia bacterium]|nr:SMC-Scp complex subunit ScpB [Clostridia bacterium]
MQEQLEQIKNIEAAIEAILYAAGHPVEYDRIAEVLGLTKRDVKRMVEHMAEAYNGENSTHGINLLTYDESCQFCTKEIYAPYIREALGIRRGGNLSASSMEVLAVVAYNQPVTRTYIDTIRGVDSNYAVNSLIDKGLIRAVDRLDAPGRPMLYGTTEKFLRVFGISSLADLPETEMMPMNIDANGEVNTAQMVMQIPQTGETEEVDDDPSPDVPVSAAPITETVTND